MRILIVTSSFPSHSGDSSGAFIANLVKAVGKQGQKCVVLTPATTKPSDWSTGCEVYRFRYAPWRWQMIAQKPGGIPTALKKRPLLYILVPIFLSSLTNSILKLAPSCDLVHAHWSINGALAVLMRHFHKRPVITTLHGSDHVKGSNGIGPFAWLHRKAVLGSSAVAAVSEKILAQMKVRYPDKIDFFHFVPNGVDEKFYLVQRGRKTTRDHLNILFIGSLIPIKGVEILLKAVSEMKEKSKVTVTLVGDGPNKEDLQRMVQLLAIESQVNFLGAVPPSQIPGLMQEHQLLVLPSYREGRPSVVLEAMAAAMPVVATDIDGTRELVQDGKTGWLFPPGDSESLAAILSSVINGEKDLESAGEAGRRWMLDNNMTWDETAKRYIQLYKHAISV